MEVRFYMLGGLEDKICERRGKHTKMTPRF